MEATHQFSAKIHSRTDWWFLISMVHIYIYIIYIYIYDVHIPCTRYIYRERESYCAYAIEESGPSVEGAYMYNVHTQHTCMYDVLCTSMYLYDVHVRIIYIVHRTRYDVHSTRYIVLTSYSHRKHTVLCTHYFSRLCAYCLLVD